MQVKWLRRALRNLDEEAACIAQDSPGSAADFVAHMMQSARMLAAHPHMGRPGRVPGTRELVVTRFPYILPYRVREQTVEILRVFHTARKWPQRFDR
ncbi:MAG: type II toxin-antitoxin system RelE/ParE family toxin [Rhodocyclaceae bacterium]|nr:type II toxin-antitoxin system RelE/ParE family toxin [Rhodocyclaceae bacterium]